MTFIQAPDRSGAFDASPYVRHLGDVTSTSVASPATETVEVNPKIGQLLGGPVALVFSVYSALANGAVSVGSMAPKMVMEYGNQTVECAFDFKNSAAALESNIYTYVIGVVEIDGDSISLSPSGQTSNRPCCARRRPPCRGVAVPSRGMDAVADACRFCGKGDHGRPGSIQGEYGE